MSEASERLRVVVDGPIDPRLVAPAIRRVLEGGAWPQGPERQVADAVLARRDASLSPANERGRHS